MACCRGPAGMPASRPGRPAVPRVPGACPGVWQTAGADAAVPPPAYELGGGMTASRWPKSTRGASRCSPTASKYSARSMLNSAGDDVARHGLDLGVQVAHVGVVVAARGGDAVLGGGQLVLQGHEVLVGLEVGVGLDDREQAAERLAEHVLALGLLGRRLTGRHRGGAGLDDVLEGAALVRRVALDGLDEVADQVVPAGQLDVDLAPGLLHQVAQLDQAVVGHDRPADDHDQDDDEDDDGNHGCSRARTGGLTRS